MSPRSIIDLLLSCSCIQCTYQNKSKHSKVGSDTRTNMAAEKNKK